MKNIALVKRCQKGEKDAFEKLIRLYYPYVYGFLLKMSKDTHLSEDLTQDTFLKMIQKIELFKCDGKTAFGTWLIAIAKNCFIDNMRKNSVVVENYDDLQLTDFNDVSDEIITKMEYEEFLKASEKLPYEQQLAIKLKYEENLTLKEIAERFGVQPKTIKSRIHDGKVKLRKMLRANEKEEHL